ncbi:MAG: CRTAC1 family protein [Planctomycetes bacterium]|nr:CRTAC1 family protein [Planctomycetota bacterium]
MIPHALIAVSFAPLPCWQEPPAAPAAPAPAAADGDDCCHDAAPPTPATLPMDRKSVLLRKLADEVEATTVAFLGRREVEVREKQLAALPRNAPPAQQYMARVNLSEALLKEGEVERAIEQLQRALDLAIAQRDPKATVNAWRRSALAWLRFGERRNCRANHNADSCLLPIAGGGIHAEAKGSREAVRLLERVLYADGSDYAAMWLLNVAHMTLGSWPDGVPKQWRIPAHAFDSEFELPRMRDEARELGLAAFTRAGGSCMDDFDGDGRLDLVTSSMDARQPLRMMRQQEDGTFRDVAEKVGLAGQLGGLNLHHFDANDDGRLDLLVQRGAWLGLEGRFPNSLLIQQEDGTFVDRTLEAGLEILAPSQVAVSADIDLDGDLDLFLGYEGKEATATDEFRSHLFRNRGDATFEDITAVAGVENGRFCKGAAFGDYDGDGLPDLYVSNLGGPNRLYHNEGDGRFTDVALDLGVEEPLDSFGCWFFDYDNDGDLDLYSTCYEQRERPTTIFGYYKNGATGFNTMRLYRNDPGRFSDVTRAVGLDRTVFPMGCNFGDIDEDGFPDLYLATGDPDFASLWPNVMLRNDRGERFQDVTTTTGTGHLQKGHGVSFGDLDGDGDQDLHVQIGGAFVDDAFSDALYRNPGHGRHWLTVRLVGRQSNRFGVGARVAATIEEGGATRQVVAFVGANSSFGGNSLQSELGLGRATRLVALEVTWPGGTRTQRFTEVELDRCVVIDEEAGLRVVARP